MTSLTETFRTERRGGMAIDSPFGVVVLIRCEEVEQSVGWCVSITVDQSSERIVQRRISEFFFVRLPMYIELLCPSPFFNFPFASNECEEVKQIATAVDYDTISTVKNPEKTSCGEFLENWAKSCSMTVKEMGEHFASRKGRVSSESDLFVALSGHTEDFLGSSAPGGRSSITYEQWIVRVVTNRLPLLERRSDRPPKGRTWWSEMLVSLAALSIAVGLQPRPH